MRSTHGSGSAAAAGHHVRAASTGWRPTRPCPRRARARQPPAMHSGPPRRRRRPAATGWSPATRPCRRSWTTCAGLAPRLGCRRAQLLDQPGNGDRRRVPGQRPREHVAHEEGPGRPHTARAASRHTVGPAECPPTSRPAVEPTNGGDPAPRTVRCPRCSDTTRPSRHLHSQWKACHGVDVKRVRRLAPVTSRRGTAGVSLRLEPPIGLGLAFHVVGHAAPTTECSE